MRRLPMILSLIAAIGVADITAATAADVGPGYRDGNAVTRFFGRFRKSPETRPVAPATNPVPGYIAREADREGPLEVYTTPMERNVNGYDKRLNIGRAIDEHLFGLPESPERELEDKYRRSQLPDAQTRSSGIFAGLETIRTGRVRGAPTTTSGNTVVLAPNGSVYSDGTATNAAPRIQDVAKLCNDPRTLADIVKRFNWAQKNTWETHLRMTAIGHAREHGYRTVGDYAYLSKRYCQARAKLSNGHHRTLVYQIVEDTGGAGGFYDRAQFCVQGFDRMNQYEPACRVLRFN